MGESSFEGYSLEAAKTWVQQHLVKGIKCPCCGQFAKMYSRPINRGQVKALLNLYVAGDIYKYCHWPPMDPSHGDAAKLRYWRLVEEEKILREDGGRAGWWRVTERGEDFLKGELELPWRVKLWDDEFHGFDDSKTVTVHDCWKKRFDLRELMGE